MAVSVFTDNEVFLNEEVNIACNLFLDLVQTFFSPAAVDAGFVLTGSVAKIIQAEPVVEIKVIPFITDDQEMFDFVAQKMAYNLPLTVIAFEDVLHINYQGIYFEVWLGVVGVVNDVDGLKVQDLADIPVNIL